MPRPHTEFVQSHALAWQRWTRPGLAQPIHARTLSHDPIEGGASLMLRFPP